MNLAVFKSQNNLFQLSLPDGWQYSYEDNIYTFYNEERIQGVLQISSYYTENDSRFNLQRQLVEEQKKHPSAQIIDHTIYDAVHYATEDHANKLINYYWIIGLENVRLFCSLIINSMQNDAILDDVYLEVVNLVNTIKINPI